MKQKELQNNKTNKWIILVVVIAMTFMATLDSSIVNVALPVMSKELNVPLSSIEWIIAGYIITICSTILCFGRLGDMIGKTKVFQFGSILFTIGSLLCGISRSFTALLIFRFIQGIGASAYMANNHGIITEIFQKDKLGKALGILVTSVAMGTMIGPVTGGLIVSALNWNCIFLINVPIGIVVFIMGLKFLPKGIKTGQTLDLAGTIVQFLAMVLFFGAFMLAQKTGFNNRWIIISLIISILLFFIFLHIEHRKNEPLLELKIFKNKLFSINLICAFISFTCLSASSILLPFYYQYTMKQPPAVAGFLLIVSPIILAIFSPLGGMLSDKIGAEILCLIGLVIMSCAFLLLSLLNENSMLIQAVASLALMSFGQSLFQPANNTLIMSNCPNEQRGIAGSVNSLVRNLGQLVGVALSTTFLYYFMSLKLHYHVLGYVFGKDYAFVYGMNHNYIILALLCCIGIILNGIRIYKKKFAKFQSF